MSDIKTIPPAETFIINKLEEKYPNENRPRTPKDVEEWLIEFAKMHVKEALKCASEKAVASEYWGDKIDEPELVVHKDSILNAYPLTSIE